MSTTLAFNGFDFTTTSSPRGGRFKLLGLDGWISVAQRRDRLEKSQQAGAWESTGAANSLPITARGQAVYTDNASAALERRELVALGGNARYAMTVVDAAGEGTRVVECDSLMVSPVRDAMFSWALVVTACDPLLYGPATFAQVSLSSSGAGTGRVWPRVWPTDWGVPAGATPGAVSLANAGTAGYWPRVRIDGPVTNPVLTLNETGDTVRFDGTVADGQWLDVECDRRRVTLNGVASRRFAVSASGNWLAVPPGGGSLSAAADSSGASTLVSVWGYEGAWQ